MTHTFDSLLLYFVLETQQLLLLGAHEKLDETSTLDAPILPEHINQPRSQWGTIRSYHIFRHLNQCLFQGSQNNN